MEAKDKKLQFIKEVLCAFYGVDASVYERKGKRSEVVQMKHYAIHFALKNTSISVQELADEFGVTHAAVVHARKKLENWLQFDADLRKEFEEIQSIIVNRIALASGELSEEVYYIDLNNFVSIRQPNGKAIILVGFTPEEVEKFNSKQLPTREHKNKGLYVFERK